MGKRSSFKRRPQDAYDTPPEAVVPLIPHIYREHKPVRFCEPCAGKGDLVDALTAYGLVCARARDIEPRRDDIERKDALTTLTGNIDYFITNPPWTRAILHPLIELLSDQHPTWLLFDADWIHTKQAAPYLWRLRKIVSVGRLKWIPDSPHTGKDNVAWHLFDAHSEGRAQFFGRAA